MKKVLVLLLALMLFSCGMEAPVTMDKDEIYKLCEMAYFEGQKDAIEGDVRIKLGSDSIYVWTKSPWADKGVGDKPIHYHPTYMDSK